MFGSHGLHMVVALGFAVGAGVTFGASLNAANGLNTLVSAAAPDDIAPDRIGQNFSPAIRSSHAIDPPNDSPRAPPRRSRGSVVGHYTAHIVSAHDGDTMRAHVEVWPSQTMEATIRLRGVDTPELNADCAGEVELARKARDYVRLLTIGKTVTLDEVSKGKYYGRVIASVTLNDGRSLATVLLEEGLGRPYGGGKRQDWCSLLGEVSGGVR
ncbi:MAG: thermonuclease family protein [Pseudomonadota bacterium]